ncbi:hypothetical protein BS47DRAFT_1367610 [Hydnum rufescens UP504]|uniref:Secreted protein n=1 Tax=Hydnum rufescens UP504 TaxID=1448309 RepID=A0A9P6AIB3_9AGAM|nr:hypothetical protein BS47DRAFT_1367610 [Hydnum rufescens UP504]
MSRTWVLFECWHLPALSCALRNCAATHRTDNRERQANDHTPAAAGVWSCKIMAWWLERKPANDEGRMAPNDTMTNHRLNHKKPPPNEPPQNNNLHATPESSPTKTVPEDHESHKNHAPAKGVHWFSRLSICTHNPHKP